MSEAHDASAVDLSGTERRILIACGEGPQKASELLSALGEAFSVAVCRVVTIVSVQKPALTGVRVNESVLGGVAENTLEDQPVRLTVVGEIGAKNLPQQLAALLQDNFELFYAGRAVGLIGNFIRVSAFQLSKTVFKSVKAASEKFRIDAHGFCGFQPRPPSVFSGSSYLWKVPQNNE